MILISIQVRKLQNVINDTSNAALSEHYRIVYYFRQEQCIGYFRQHVEDYKHINSKELT